MTESNTGLSTLLDPSSLPPLPNFNTTIQRDKEVEIMMVIQKKTIHELTLEDIDCMERYYLLPEEIMEEYNTNMFNESSLFLLTKIEQRGDQLHDLINECIKLDNYSILLDILMMIYI